MLPSAAGGAQSMRCGQPASCAGAASIIAVEGSGAAPAGTYSPTASRGRYRCSQTTPGTGSVRESEGLWAAWQARMLSSAA